MNTGNWQFPFREWFQDKQDVTTARPFAYEPPSGTKLHNKICKFLVFCTAKKSERGWPRHPIRPKERCFPLLTRVLCVLCWLETRLEFSRSYSVKPILFNRSHRVILLQSCEPEFETLNIVMEIITLLDSNKWFFFFFFKVGQRNWMKGEIRLVTEKKTKTKNHNGAF